MELSLAVNGSLVALSRFGMSIPLITELDKQVTSHLLHGTVPNPFRRKGGRVLLRQDRYNYCRGSGSGGCCRHRVRFLLLVGAFH